MLRNLHHANLLVGTLEEAEFYLRSLCGGLGIELPNNPDFFTLKAETFGIDEARELRVWSTRKAVTSSKIFLILPARLTLEAQNALLKTFEEPFSNTYFFLVVEEGVLSRRLYVPECRQSVYLKTVFSHPRWQKDFCLYLSRTDSFLRRNLPMKKKI